MFSEIRAVWVRFLISNEGGAARTIFKTMTFIALSWVQFLLITLDGDFGDGRDSSDSV